MSLKKWVWSQNQIHFESFAAMTVHRPLPPAEEGKLMSITLTTETAGFGF
jgi:hypothetical protein